MRLTKKEPTANFDDFPVSNVSFGPKLSEARPAESAGVRTLTKAVIGPKIKLKGELTGTEDILIQGEVEGSIDLGDNEINVGSEGVIKANIKARIITTEGSVTGDLEARELITVKSNSKINGNLKADRVNLEDGAKFRGGIDMSLDK